jgi:AcrR family transcriptional regulator
MPKVGMQPIRRQQLIEATLQAVDQVGLGDASIALIARLAGVSNGIISHYFQDKNGLIAATMRYIMNMLNEGVIARRQALTDDSPRAHLRVIIEGNFDASQVNGPAMKTGWPSGPPACTSRPCTGCSGSTITACIPTCAASSAAPCRSMKRAPPPAAWLP